jgi:MFS family permease
MNAPGELPGRPPPGGLLRRAPAFRALWLARAVSYTGDGISQVAIVLLASGSGPAAVGLALLANTAPRLLGPLAGALADRVERRRLMTACQLCQGLVMALLAALPPALPTLLALSAVAGLLATVFGPAARSATPRLVDHQDLGRANAMLGTALNLQVILGPALGGLLVAQGGPRTAFAVDALSFAVSAALLARLPRLGADGVGQRAPGLLADSLAGLAYVARTPGPRALVLGLLLVVSFAAVDNVALVFLVRDTLGGDARDYGAVQATYGLGMLTASVALTRMFARRSPLALLAAGIAATGAGTLLTGLAPAVGVAAAWQALAGAGNAVENIANDTAVQRLVPRHLHGRVFGATATAAQAGSVVAYAAGGPLLAATSPRAVFAIAAAGVFSALLVLLPLLRSARTSGPRHAGHGGPAPGRSG